MTAHTDSDALDAADMERLAAGHDTALNDLMERHGKRLFHYLIRCLQSEEDAADLAQETFVRVYQNRTKFKPGAKFSTWLYTIATNLVKTRYRFRTRHPEVSLDAENEQSEHTFRETVSSNDLTPSDRLQTAERAEAVRQAVAGLPDDLRTPLILAEYEERSQAEIGEVLGCTAKAVEVRLYRARQLLRAALKSSLEEG
jgi:RNA polymerase sigma-70 factor (ECF subfamily)